MSIRTYTYISGTNIDIFQLVIFGRILFICNNLVYIVTKYWQVNGNVIDEKI